MPSILLGEVILFILTFNPFEPELIVNAWLILGTSSKTRWLIFKIRFLSTLCQLYTKSSAAYVFKLIVRLFAIFGTLISSKTVSVFSVINSLLLSSLKIKFLRYSVIPAREDLSLFFILVNLNSSLKSRIFFNWSCIITE